MEQYMLWIWLGVFVSAVILEAVTQDFVSIWFSVGALVCLCICNTIPYWVEIIIFSVISLITLILTRPLVKKLMDRNVRYTNVDEVIGKRVKVIKEISKYDAGEVKINGIIYTAILLEDIEETIKVDSIVEIVAFKGNKVSVRELNQESDIIQL
jgi:membrane protein implicated in regulation of membrane protease activity